MAEAPTETTHHGPICHWRLPRIAMPARPDPLKWSNRLVTATPEATDRMLIQSLDDAGPPHTATVHSDERPDAVEPATTQRPGRQILGISAILLPLTEGGDADSVDWRGFDNHVTPDHRCWFGPRNQHGHRLCEPHQ